MKAISLWQPWASLIACGAKPFETRHWAPPRALIGQPIAIHAAKRVDRDAAAFATDLMYGQHQPGGFALADKLSATMRGTPDDLMGIFGRATMPAGCIVCIVRLEAAFQLGERDDGASLPAAKIVRRLAARPMLEWVNVVYDDFGDYTAGRWAWLLSDVKPLRPPTPIKGAQGFFELPQGWLAA